MKHLVVKQQWDKHSDDKHVWLIDDTIVGMCTVQYMDDSTTLIGVWVHEDYRGKGYSKIMMDDINAKDTPMSLMVRKDNDVAINLYKKYCFEFWYDEDDYQWMKNYNEVKILNKTKHVMSFDVDDTLGKRNDFK